MLEFHLSTIFFTILNLLVLYFFFRKFLFGRVNAILDQRAALVQGTVDKARQDEQQAQALKTRYESELQQAQHQAQAILAQAKVQGQQQYEEVLAHAQQDAKTLQAEAQRRIQAEHDQMLQAARGELASLALLAASRLAQKSLDGDAQRAFVDSFLSQVGDDHG